MEKARHGGAHLRRPGYALTRALRKAGGEAAQEELLEVDILRSRDHDMLEDAGVYSGLLVAALENKIKAVITGPNCRTRSVLRHRPLPGGGGPRPLRAWGDGQEFGIPGLTDQELKMVLEDDILMWRSILAKYVSDVSDEVKEPPYFTMEQPSSPMQYNPEVVSVWDTKEWLAIKNEFGFTETNFETEKPDQENYSGGADAASLRIIVKKAAVMGWEGLTMDVKTAFLNAELNEEEEDDYVVIKPPAGDDFTGIFWAEGDVLGQAGRIRT